MSKFCIVPSCGQVKATGVAFCRDHQKGLSPDEKQVLIKSIQAANKASDEQVGGGHYKELVIQPAEFSERNRLTFLEGCVVKRDCRHRNKNGAEDIRKAIHELQLILEYEYGEE